MIKDVKNFRILEWRSDEKLSPYFESYSNVYCVTTTNEYLKYASVTIYSIIANTNKKIEIIIFTDFIDINKIKKIFKKFKNVFFSIIIMEKVKTFKNVYWPDIIGKRIMLLSNFFSKYEKIVSLETDTFIFDNIDELFDNKYKKFISGSLEFSISNNISLNWTIPKKYIDFLKNNNKKMNLNFGVTLKEYLDNYLKIDHDKYINCGFFLLSFEHFENYKIENKLSELNKFVFLDQDFINKHLKNHIEILSFQYNFNPEILFNRNIIFSKFDKYFDKNQIPKIVHFSGASTKPWSKYKNNVLYKKWWSYAKKTNRKWFFYWILNFLKHFLFKVKNFIKLIFKFTIKYYYK